jgi:hypothetical protein
MQDLKEIDTSNVIVAPNSNAGVSGLGFTHTNLVTETTVEPIAPIEPAPVVEAAPNSTATETTIAEGQTEPAK